MVFRPVLSQESPADFFACALFLILAFLLAGIPHTAWLSSRISRRFGIPLDFGAMWRGKRILGDHKTARGLVVMIPAAGGTFFVLGAILHAYPALLARVWPLSPASYAVLGTGAGLGFMLGELPNSFVKRRLDIPPGAPAVQPILRPVFFLADRVDSIIGMLIAVSLMVPTPWQTWLYMALLGPGLHWLFSAILHRCGGKGRAS